MLVGDLLRRAGPRAVRDALARRARRRSPRSCCGRWRRGARASAACSPGSFVIAGVLALALTLWRPLIDERLAAKSKVATANVESRKAYWRAAASDGGRPPAARRRAGALRDREPQLRPQRPAQHRGPGRPQRLPGGAGRGRRADAARVPGVHRRVVGADRAGAKTVPRGRGPRRAADRPPRCRRRSSWRSCRRTSCRCRRRCRCGCSAAWRRCSRSGRPAHASEGRARHVDPPRRAARARGAARARPRRARRRTCARWRCDDGGRRAVRRGRRARRGAAAARPFDPAGAVRVHRFVRGADVVHSHDRRSGLWVRLGPRGGAARACTRSTACPEPYLADGRPGLKARGSPTAASSARCGASPTCSSRPRTRWRGCWPSGSATTLEELVVVPNGVDVPAAPLPRGELVGTLVAARAGQGPRRTSSTRRGSCSRAAGTRFVIFGTARWRRSCARGRRGLPVEFAGYVPGARGAARSSRCSCCRRSWRTARSRCWRRWRPASRRSRRRRRRHPGVRARPTTLVAAARPGGAGGGDPRAARRSRARRERDAAPAAPRPPERSAAADRGADARALRGALSRASVALRPPVA